jgi:3-oxoacyl-[acyl-carrier protein] reductase
VNFGLKGKVALVAAASRGLGRAVAEELAAEGANLVLCARGKEPLDRAAEAIVAATGVAVLAEPADVSDPDAVLPGMKARRWGRIIHITSIAVKQPVDALMLSNSLRAAVTGFARTLATEVAPFGVTVNNALPGYTRTERVEQLARASEARGGPSADAVRRGWEAQIPMGRLGEAREFGALVAFLASERASYITAASIAVDGGWIRSLL